MLKPLKNTSSASAMLHIEGAMPLAWRPASHHSASCTSPTSTMEVRNTSRSRPWRSMRNSTPPMTTKEPITAGRYTSQWWFLSSPACTSSMGTTIHMASCTACSTNTLTLSRSMSGWRSTAASEPPTAWPLCSGGSSGTIRYRPAMASRASTATSQNMPDRPMSASSSGERISATENTRPMLPPMMAMALVRTASRVRSASRAVTAADTAPAPCRARPQSRPSSEVASAATALPMAKTTSPSVIMRLRPKRSDAMPKGSCSTAWVRPYTPMARPMLAGLAPG